ncbi:diguanylate cyclase [Streptomyces sp. NPDC056159]|uniref:diguanylate cyclase domain-containing protein n=1 Tax=unclassified Streptomyces TaxID=2593676 RepID=UPI0034389593
MVDADHFNAVSDTMGHAAGDAVLAAYGARLTAWAGPRAAAGRLGGDDAAPDSEVGGVSRASQAPPGRSVAGLLIKGLADQRG